MKLGMNHPMGPLQLGKLNYNYEQNPNTNKPVHIQRICAFLMISLNFETSVAKVLIASVLTPV
jgi:hypothetical protein